VRSESKSPVCHLYAHGVRRVVHRGAPQVPPHCAVLQEKEKKLFGSIVGRNILEEIMRNGADLQNTDVCPQTPTKATYADIAKLPIRMSSLRVRGA
jgi:hypothetical protein